MSASESTVIFRDVPDCPGFRVSNTGIVLSERMHRRLGKPSNGKWYQLKPQVHHGYHRVAFKIGKSNRWHWVHRLVLEAFVGPCPPGMQCRHLNGNPADNRVENLAWGTTKENGRDRVVMGTALRGEKINRAKLTESEVRVIRNKSSLGMTYKDIAKEHHVTDVCIAQVVKRRTWTHVV